ncbi:MAG: hypothetical protein ACLTQG_30700 [Hungatella sp.]
MRTPLHLRDNDKRIEPKFELESEEQVKNYRYSEDSALLHVW